MYVRVTFIGQASWGIAWYINGVLAPELVVQRGVNYTFVVTGGTDPNDPTNYHPFYITNSSSGGRLANTAEQREVNILITIQLMDSELSIVYP